MKKELLKHILTILFIILVILLMIPNQSNADVPKTINPSSWEPPQMNTNDVKEITDAAATLVDYIRYIGIIVTVVALLALGIKYMVGSIEEKAEYKKSMKAYIIGVVLFFALSQIIAVIIDVADAL